MQLCQAWPRSPHSASGRSRLHSHQLRAGEGQAPLPWLTSSGQLDQRAATSPGGVGTLPQAHRLTRGLLSLRPAPRRKD